MSTYSDLQRRFLWHGFLLMTVALSTGLLIPFYANIRTGLAAHVIGITGGLFLMAVGFTLPFLNLSNRQLLTVFWMLVCSLYAGFFAQVLGAWYGLSRMFVVTAAGMPLGNLTLETVVEIVTKASTPTTLFPCLLILYGLRKR